MSNFNRWSSWFPRSFAYARFREHHTEINELYWSLAPAAGYTDYLARHASAGTTPDALFHATGPNARRISPSIDQWRLHFSKFQNWTRLSTLVSAMSYFESYISTVSTLALRSDPLLRFGQSMVVDGTSWLKANVPDDVSARIVQLVKGTWPARLSAYRGLFGHAPPQLTNRLSELERMRQLRNGVAHSFGRDPAYFEDPMVPAGEPVRLSERRLLGWLSIIEECAEAVDDQLFRSHIGEFELVWRYHRWKDQPREAIDKRYSKSAAFSRVLVRGFGSGPGRGFCKGLIAYYDAI